MDDRRTGKEGGGLAAVVIVGALIAMLLLGLASGIFYVRHLQRMAILEAHRATLAAREAAERALAAEAAMQAEAKLRRANQEAGLSDPPVAPTK